MRPTILTFFKNAVNWCKVALTLDIVSWYQAIEEISWSDPLHGIFHTICPRSSDPFYIVSYNIKCVTISWTYRKYRWGVTTWNPMAVARYSPRESHLRWPSFRNWNRKRFGKDYRLKERESLQEFERDWEVYTVHSTHTCHMQNNYNYKGIFLRSTLQRDLLVNIFCFLILTKEKI